MKVYELSRNAVIDGKKYSTMDEQLAALKFRPEGAKKAVADDTDMGRPVIIKLNSKDVITLIDTDTPNTIVTTCFILCGFIKISLQTRVKCPQVYKRR